MSKQKAEISLVLKRAEETLQTAHLGLKDLLAADPTRRRTGLRNLIVFGRAVTFVLQNLRPIVPDEFNRWYEPKQAEMSADPLMRFFVDARNKLEKEGIISVAQHLRIHSFNFGTDMTKFGTPPVGAKSFFIGDQLGGTGWEVEVADGKTEKYYVELPSSIGETAQYFSNFPVAEAPELSGRSVEDLCSIYLERLDILLGDARKHFLENRREA